MAERAEQRQPRVPAQVERPLVSAYRVGAARDVETILSLNDDDDRAHRLIARTLAYASEKSSDGYVRECYVAHFVPTPYLYE